MDNISKTPWAKEGEALRSELFKAALRRSEDGDGKGALHFVQALDLLEGVAGRVANDRY